MLKEFRGASLGFAMALAAMALSGGASLAAGVTDSEIVVGTHMDLSGPVSAGNPQMRYGTQMRFDEANDAGGINGRKFRFIVEDNGSQPQMAVRAVDKLIKRDQVFAIVNPFGSGPNAAVVKRAVDAGVIYFAPWAAASVLHKIAGDTKLLFTTFPNYDTTTETALNWMLDRFKAKRVGYLYQEGPLGELVGVGVKRALAKRGMTLAAEAGYKVGDIDFSSQVARMKAASVDLIVAATLVRETVGVAAEVKKLGWSDVKILTANSGRTGTAVKIGKGALEGMYGVGPWSATLPAEGTAAEKKWAADFQHRYNLEPDENALLAYAYTDWFVRAVQAAGKNVTTDSVVKTLQTTTEENPIFYEPLKLVNGHISPESLKVDEVKDGRWVPVSELLH